MDSGIVLAVVGWFVGSFVSGLCGLGGALIAIPLMLLALPMHDAILISCLVSLPVVLAMGVYYLRFARKGVLCHLLLGLVPGSFAGLHLLEVLSGQTLQFALGLLIIASILALHFLGPRLRIRESAPANILVGFLGGVGGTAVSVDGPVIGLYSLLVGWQPQAWLGIGSVYYLMRCSATCLLQWQAGLYTPEIWHHVLWTVPAALLGVAASVPIVKRIRVDRFRSMVKIVLVLAGISCLVRAF